MLAVGFPAKTTCKHISLVASISAVAVPNLPKQKAVGDGLVRLRHCTKLAYGLYLSVISTLRIEWRLENTIHVLCSQCQL